MKKSLLLLIFCSFMSLWTIAVKADITLSKEYFPDDSFREDLVRILGIKEGDVITEEKIASTKTLDIHSNYFIGEDGLSGIEYFTALEELNCSSCMLTALDLTKNKALKRLNCASNYLTSLNIKGLDRLEYLNIHRNYDLPAPDLSTCSALTEINCGTNGFKGGSMDYLVEHLPQRKNEAKKGAFCVFNPRNGDLEKNECTKKQVATALERGWQPMYWNGRSWHNYEGIPTDNLIFTLKDGEISEENSKDFIVILNTLMETGELIGNEGDNGTAYTNKDGKPLFSLQMPEEGKVIVSLAENVSAADNITHELTNEERLALNQTFPIYDYFTIKSFILQFGSDNPADVNKDGAVDSADIVAVIKEMPDGDKKADVNGDGAIDSADIVAVIKAMK